MPLKVIFMGTPDFAVPVFEAILHAGHRMVAAYTRAPRPAGRGQAPTPSPIARAAEQAGVPIETPGTLKNTIEQQRFASFAPDVAVVVAYGLLLPQEILTLPRLGCLNLHASLLPRWRGAAPIQRAIMAGDRQSGIMVMRMEEGLDTGPIALTLRTPIAANETAGELHDRLRALSPPLMVEALNLLEAGKLMFTAQDDTGIVYAKKIEKAEARIDWTCPADVVASHIHGLSPFPGAWCEVKGPAGVERMKFLKVERHAQSGTPGTVLDDQLTIACGTGAIRPILIQRAGRKVMDRETLLRGLALTRGMSLL